jgi:hypothetical protein
MQSVNVNEVEKIGIAFPRTEEKFLFHGGKIKKSAQKIFGTGEFYLRAEVRAISLMLAGINTGELTSLQWMIRIFLPAGRHACSSQVRPPDLQQTQC